MTRRTGTICALGALLWQMPCGVWAEGVKTKGKAPPDEVRVVRLTVSPAAEPRPALEYRLLPAMARQVDGNAAPLYYTGALLMLTGDRKKTEFVKKFQKWLDVPIADLPRQEVRDLLAELRHALRYVELASLRRHCQWSHPLGEGYMLLLPELSPLRCLGMALAVRARLEMVEGRWGDAVNSIRALLTMARHISQADLIIHSLVGTSCGSMAMRRVEELLRLQNAPSLYWPLSNLPSPLVDLGRALDSEAALLYASLPGLRGVDTDRRTPEQWRELLVELASLVETAGGPESEYRGWSGELLAGLTAMKAYPEAKRYLLATGRAAEEVEAMSVPRAILIHNVSAWHEVSDDQRKWLAMPYWQGHAGLAAARESIEQLRPEASGMLVAALMVASERAYLVTARLDRHVAALRCVEALRLHASSHDRKWPGSLRDIDSVPVPIDPLTGKAFPYRIEDGRAILDVPPVPADDLKHAIRYELTLWQ